MGAKVPKGASEQVTVYTGILNPGEPSGVPIIKRLFALNKPKTEQQRFIDCPPGSSCIVMESIKDAEYCILVAEPTLFGVHNLNMVYELVKLFEKPFGVVLNKCLEEENPAEKFCEDKDITILGRIPFDHELGILNSNAEVAVRYSAKYRAIFSALLETVEKEVSHETTAHS